MTKSLIKSKYITDDVRMILLLYVSLFPFKKKVSLSFSNPTALGMPFFLSFSNPLLIPSSSKWSDWGVGNFLLG